jgi:predicted aspartyl protease
MIDTGFNGFVTLSAKHVEGLEIDTTNAFYGKSTVSGGFHPGFSILADTIKIGNLFTANQDMRIEFDNVISSEIALLGTETLENFSVILDLINFDLYLKKIDN